MKTKCKVFHEMPGMLESEINKWLEIEIEIEIKGPQGQNETISRRPYILNTVSSGTAVVIFYN